MLYTRGELVWLSEQLAVRLNSCPAALEAFANTMKENQRVRARHLESSAVSESLDLEDWYIYIRIRLHQG